MTNKKGNSQTQSWNTQDLIKMSQNLGEAFLPGLDNGKSNEKGDFLTVSELVKINKERSKNESDI